MIDLVKSLLLRSRSMVSRSSSNKSSAEGAALTPQVHKEGIDR